ncbi:MAG: hypothetical protein A3G60_00260 [Candidatus Ryanbacteria bacterium RIFCSPLOWO2_12_FULL_47_9c]|uniref:Membrane insertase YidC/Oxa/ALB C-terminal domain-containing protein n=1 Tax=Candidatus Ryanbacteria bacterium RIFCSPLOWO2_12_FULL_47_9c TaxID=1802131 RepID=A0A1G2H1Q1_9BACT|nr:MAG: hypothetical protein A3G60_00260 [Candidatus Ryanbacteria bacterium RIFCSPLOWO2_12_FULL_47_9c]
MSSIFHNLFYRPILNALGVFIVFLPGSSFGSAIILLTIAINILLLPLTHRMKRSQQKMNEIQPHLERIKQQYKDSKEEQARRTLELYRQHNINPFSGFLLLFVQIPLFIALFRVLQASNESFRSDLYPILPNVPPLDPLFLGFINLAAPNIFLAIIAGVTQFIQGKLLVPPASSVSKEKENDFQQIMQKQMRYVMPVFILILGMQLPSALSLYWTTLSIFGIVHEGIVRHRARAISRSHGEHTGDRK